MTKTLLQLTQDILSVIDGDEVNSISDTEESEQVAKIIVRTYNSIVSNSNWYHTRTGINLVPFTDSNFPTHMRLPSNVKELVFINYDKSKLAQERSAYGEVVWKSPDDLLRLMNSRDDTQVTTQTVTDPSGIKLFLLNDKAPEYYTSFNDSDLVFDSYDSEVDSTLQANKVQAVAYILPTMEVLDGATHDLPPDAESLLLEEATKKSQWWVRQVEDPIAEQEAKRQGRWLSRKQWRVKGGITYPDYGRKGSTNSSTRRRIRNGDL